MSALPEQVLRAYLKADKGRTSVLRACAAWLAAPAPVEPALRGASA